ncbi:MAG: PqiC family protein [Gammaproteobacteria bacterium]
MRFPYPRALGLVLFMAAVSGCGTSQPTRYYLLSASATEAYGDPQRRELSIGVGPVVLPAYLDRREVVSRSSSNELDVPVYHQWAEPLQENFGRVVREDLARRLATDRVIHLPLKRSLRNALNIDYQVAIVVRKFEKMSGGSVVLDSRWVILDNDKQELMLRRSEYRQSPSSQDYAAQVAAQSEVLGRLSEEIAAAIVQLERNAAR